MSFFVNAGMRFVTELAKMRAFVELWDEITHVRFGVADPSKRRFRYGVQVNSLGLTEQQPENNAYRILIEMLSVVLSRGARARAVQLPAWNEALGLPRPFDQQWSLRLQQIMAYETDLLEFGDIFDGSTEVAALVHELKAEALAELASIDAMGGVVAAIESGAIKARLVASNARRIEAIERGEQIVVGVNAFLNSEPSPLTAGETSILVPSAEAEAEQVAALAAWRESRDPTRVREALRVLRSVAASGANIMAPSIEAAKACVTTGEWGDALKVRIRRVPCSNRGFAEGAAGSRRPRRAPQRGRAGVAEAWAPDQVSHRQAGPRRPFERGRADRGPRHGRRHGSRLRRHPLHAGRDRRARQSRRSFVGLSILSGSHVALAEEALDLLRAAGLSRIPVVVGGIIPPADAERLKAAGVAAVYTPKDFAINGILGAIVQEIEARFDAEQTAGAGPPPKARDTTRA